MKHNKALMKTAYIWAAESYCKKKQVGTVISRNSRIISTGFNGTLSGLDNQCEELVAFDSKGQLEKYKIAEPHFVVSCKDCDATGWRDGASAIFGSPVCSRCEGLGHLRDTNKTNPFTLHAEYNAIICANNEGKSLKGTTLHVTLAPCGDCAKLIAANKITHVVYDEDYKNEGIDFLKKCGIKVTKYSE